MSPRRRLKSSLLVTEKNEQLFALDTDNGRVHELNVTAKAIFELFREPCEEEEAAAEFARTFDVPYEQALEDVRDMLERFRNNDLLELSAFE